MGELNRFYKISEKDFIKDEYDDLICEYNGYRIEIGYDDEYQYWCADAFDLKAEQYVFYPCLKVIDKKKMRFNEVAQRCAELIEEKINEMELNPQNDDILIYVKNDL
jgi:hypothetical protein